MQNEDPWYNYDFKGLRTELGRQIDAIINQVETRQEQGRTNNNQQLEDIALVNNEGTIIQKNLVTNLVGTTETITAIEKENHSFAKKVEEQNSYKQNISRQIHEIEHLMRLLNYEVGTQEATKEKVQLTMQREKELQERKDRDETQLVSMIQNDVEKQYHALSDQMKMIQGVEDD
jgi:hypothetical protein